MKYEKLERWCLTCRHISHDERTCLMLSEEERRAKMLEREAERNLAQLARDDQNRDRDRDILQARRQAGQISAPIRERRPPSNLQDEARQSALTIRDDRPDPKKRDNRVPDERRKRRYEESFAARKGKWEKSKGKEAVPPRDLREFPPLAKHPQKPKAPPAQQRPLLPNQKIRSSSLQKGSVVEFGESSKAASSAKKSLTFDTAKSSEAVSLPPPQNSEQPAMNLPPLPLSQKSWYEQTLEEDNEEDDLMAEDLNPVNQSVAPIHIFHTEDLELTKNPPHCEADFMEMEASAEHTGLNDAIEGIGEDDEWMDDTDLFNEEEMDKLLKDDDLLGEDFADEEEQRLELAPMEIQEEEQQRKKPSWWRSPIKLAPEQESDLGGGKSGKAAGRKKQTPRSPGPMGVSLKKRNFAAGRISPNSKGKGLKPQPGQNPSGRKHEKPTGEKKPKDEKKLTGNKKSTGDKNSKAHKTKLSSSFGVGEAQIPDNSQK
ncbi:RNA-binding protein 25-like [Eutrema salsugineum]|uniref:RNA-binding protein 25-like n=1 Tax=Eutrema salsugineum TaxID=72664 RepID=UPI000CECFF28|nr:RNA-binding protein 25-like [Eutrema salsugineum]